MRTSVLVLVGGHAAVHPVTILPYNTQTLPQVYSLLKRHVDICFYNCALLCVVRGGVPIRRLRFGVSALNFVHHLVS